MGEVVGEGERGTGDRRPAAARRLPAPLSDQEGCDCATFHAPRALALPRTGRYQDDAPGSHGRRGSALAAPASTARRATASGRGPPREPPPRTGPGRACSAAASGDAAPAPGPPPPLPVVLGPAAAAPPLLPALPSPVAAASAGASPRQAAGAAAGPAAPATPADPAAGAGAAAAGAPASNSSATATTANLHSGYLAMPTGASNSRRSSSSHVAVCSRFMASALSAAGRLS